MDGPGDKKQWTPSQAARQAAENIFRLAAPPLALFSVVTTLMTSCHSHIGVRVAQGKKSSASLTSLKPVTAKPSEAVSLTGTGFSQKQKLVAKITTVSGSILSVPVTVTSETKAGFVMPEGAGVGLTSVVIESDGVPISGAMRFVADLASNSLPIIIDDASEVCSTRQYIDRNGETQTGTKVCNSGSLSSCAADGVVGCVTTASYKSADMANVTAGNIKSGVTIAGVAGQYPSATYTLPGSSGTDLTTATFNAQIKSSATFQYFDSAGTRYTGTGDTDISSSNIANGVDVFGTTGTITSPAAWDLRVGKSVVTPSGTLAGKLLVNCRNTGNISVYDSSMPSVMVTAPGAASSTWTITDGVSTVAIGDRLQLVTPGAPTGFTNGNYYFVVSVAHPNFELSATSGGAVITATGAGSGVTQLIKTGDGTLDVWDTIDDYNNGSAVMPSQRAGGWSSDTQCGGIEVTASDSNVWKDVTTTGDGVTASTCAGTPAHCSYMDKISGLEWSKESASLLDLPAAIVYCDNLTFNGKSDWRLPTQKELMNAYEHGIRATESANYVTTFSRNYWSSTVYSNQTQLQWVVYGSNGYTFGSYKYNLNYMVCVRP